MRIARYCASGLAPRIEVTGDGRLERALGRIMVGWSLSDAHAEGGQDAPQLRVEQADDGWRCSGDGFDEPVAYADPVAAGCGVIAGLFKAHTFADPDGLCLHAAAVGFGEGLVLLTGDYRAGKSLLTAACCAAGQQAFSDDIVPLVPGGRGGSGGSGGSIARAPGLALRLRLPLPQGLDDGTRRFLAEHSVLKSHRYLYVRPPEALLARHGTEAPVRAIVAIERTDAAPPRIRRIAPGDALAELVRRNFARELPAGRILDALDRLVAGVPCLHLGYADAQEAVALMRRVFAGGGEMPELSTWHRPILAGSASARKRPAVPPAALVARGPGVRVLHRDDRAFLTDADERVIYQLNPTAAAVWRLLETPIRFAELVDVFAAAFPDGPPDRLAGDLALLIRDLDASGLVRISGQAAGASRPEGAVMTGTEVRC